MKSESDILDVIADVSLAMLYFDTLRKFIEH